MKLDYPLNLLTILLSFIPVLFRIYWDYFLIIAKNKTIGGHRGYLFHNIATASLMVGVGAINYLIAGVPIWKFFFLSWGVFFISFDIIMALLQGRHWSYIGTDKDDLSWYEQLFQILADPVVSILVRLWFMGGCIGIYYHSTLIFQ